MKLAPSQVRADIKALGCIGQRSYGYSVSALYKTIGDILQLSDRYGAVIVGNAPIAETVKSSPVFSVRGIKPVGFLKGDFSSREFNETCEKTHPDIVIIASDGEQAEKILTETEKLSFPPREVWNFSDLDLFSEKLKVKNIHVSDLLMLLCYEIGK